MTERARDSDKAPTEADTARAKHLPIVKEPTPGDTPSLVPARMINEILYCERLFYLEWVQGEFADNAYTVDGRVVHRRADKAGGNLPPIPEARRDVDPLEEHDDEERPYRARSLWLSSEALGITAKIDVVEGDNDGRVFPIEYKRGNPPDVPEGAYLPERAQLCAQVLLLREHGYTCDVAYLYFARARRRVEIAIDEALIATTKGAVVRAQRLAEAGRLPPPLDNSPKCEHCSLVTLCLPDEVHLLRRIEEKQHAKPPVTPVEVDPTPDDDDDAPLRMLIPALDDKVPLYVQEQGARIGLEGERIVVTGRKGDKVEARLPNTSQICLLGNVQISTQALRALLERDIPIAFFTSGGWYQGRAIGFEPKNIELRLAQFRAADDVQRCLVFARTFIVAKIKNCRTMLRRNHANPDAVVLFELEQLARKAADTGSVESLLGIEGSAARVYFGAFGGMLKGDVGAFDLQGRNRRPPRDPINALLSFSYALLAKDLTLALQATGLDPMLGFYHKPRFGRPALALDLMEELRPLVADSMVLSAINTRVVTDSDFERSPVGVSLSSPARKRLILAYERRMEQLVRHPVFGYRISYRRMLEVQARLLGRVLLGDISAYPAFRTR